MRPIFFVQVLPRSRTEQLRRRRAVLAWLAALACPLLLIIVHRAATCCG